MEYITMEQLRMKKQSIANVQGLDEDAKVRCYYCKKWGYNCGKVMNSVGESRCMCRTGTGAKTASYQWCKKFEYVGNGG